MPNLRIIHANYADQASTLTATSTSGALSVYNMQNDFKGQAHRSTATSVTYVLTWTGGVSIGGVALPATNLTSAATIAVRTYSDTACTALLQNSGTITACPGLALGLWQWYPPLNVNAFAYGGAAKAVAWFASNQAGVKGMYIDLIDAGNPAGYIDCARIVAGPWWAPSLNAPYGASLSQDDLSQNVRNDAGDLITDRAPMTQGLKLNLQDMPEADRSQVAQIMRANGAYKPMFVSLLPANGTAGEQDFMVYGKRKNSSLDHPSYNLFSSSLEIEGW